MRAIVTATILLLSVSAARAAILVAQAPPKPNDGEGLYIQPDVSKPPGWKSDDNDNQINAYMNDSPSPGQKIKAGRKRTVESVPAATRAKPRESPAASGSKEAASTGNVLGTVGLGAVLGLSVAAAAVVGFYLFRRRGAQDGVPNAVLIVSLASDQAVTAAVPRRREELGPARRAA